MSACDPAAAKLLPIAARHGQKKQKDRSFRPFGQNNLMLAERNRTGPALAANPATFPLNDVRYLHAPHGPVDLRKAAKLVCSGC